MGRTHNRNNNKTHSFSDFVRERDAAFTDFVLTGNLEKFEAYCKKNGIKHPTDERVIAGGIYKAVQQCTNIPQEVKDIAAKKCLEIGMSPYVF